MATRVDRVKSEVSQFHRQNSIGNTVQEAFPAWYLHRKFELHPKVAAAQSSNGSHDFGLDAFHIETATDKGPVLHLVQAKYSESKPAIKQAVRGFDRTMQEVARLLAGDQSEVPKINTVLERLAAALDRESEHRSAFRVHFTVVHLSEEPPESIERLVEPTKEKFLESASSYLVDRLVILSLTNAADLLTADVVQPPPPENELRFDGIKVPSDQSKLCYSGIGYLSDLVRLYQTYGDYLFSKNVRLYLYKAAERGPAKYMRETLRAICIPSKNGAQAPPSEFAMFHNGVTLHAKGVRQEDGRLLVRDPNVINGCQTIKNAFLFTTESGSKERIDTKLWESVPVPVRVIVTTDEDFIRRVTVSNNRQNAIRPSAFRANDPIQLKLGERFEQANIFYERQEGAFANLKRSRPAEMEDRFVNSYEKPIFMEELAQVIATASDRPALSVAARVSDLFEDAAYKQVFSEAKLTDLQLLVFLRNLFAVMPLVLKDMKEKSSTLDGLTASAFRFPCTRVMSRYVVKHEPRLVGEYGGAVISRFDARHELRVRVRQLMTYHHSDLQRHLEAWRDDSQKYGWKPAYDANAIEQVLRSTRMQNVDVFATWVALQE
jgi:hypothetical protein